MASTDLKSDKYTIGPAASGNYANSVICVNAGGTVLFKIANNQFVGTDGSTVGQIRQGGQQGGTGIYDGTGKLLGSITQQIKGGDATLNDASNKALAISSKGNGNAGFSINAPDGKSAIATVAVTAGQQSQNKLGGMGGAVLGGMMGGSMGGLGMNMMNKQKQASQSTITITVQKQSLDPLLLIAFGYALASMSGQGGTGQKKGGLGGMGGMMGAGILGGLLGGALGGGMGGSGGGSIGGGMRRGRI